ncbi:YhgE/Pip domain-containing protein [Luteococcus sediminum]
MTPSLFHVEHTGSRRPLAGWKLLALVLVPVLLAGLLLGAAHGRDDRLGQVTAAVVNSDKAVEVNGQPVPLGRQLAAEIVAKPAKNITWKLSDPADAAAGLASGEYAAVVTIPEGFSRAATSVSDADNAQQATIDVQTSPASPVEDAQIARQVAQLAAQSTNAMLTSGYLDKIYVGFNQMGQQVTTIGKGAGQLADGAEELADGADKAATGVGELGRGMGELDRNGTALVTGGDKLASGASELAGGITQYTDGTGKVVDGIGQLAGGINQLESGLARAGASGDLAQLGQLKTGAAQVAGGATGLSTGLDTYHRQLVAWRDGTAAVPPQVLQAYSQQFGGQCAAQVAQAMRGIDTGAVDAQQTELVAQLGRALDQMPAEVQLTPEQKKAVLEAAQTPVAEQLDQLVNDPELTREIAQTVCPRVQEAAQPVFTGGFRAGAGTAAAALDTKDAKTGQSLRSGAAALAAGAGQLSGGITTLVDELPKQIAAQTAQLKAGVTKLSDGADTLASQSQQLKSGGAELSSGAWTLASGLDEYTSGVAKYTDGVSQANQGVQSLAGGLGQLAAGTDQLATGTRTFAQKVSDGASQVPSYSQKQRETLSKVVATPVASDSGIVATPLSQLTSLLLVLAAWLGSIATWLLVRPVASRVLTSSRPSWQLAAATMLPGAIVALAQGVLLGVLGAVVLDLGLGRGLALTGFLVLIGLTFTAVNHALAAWLGGIGRGIAIVLATVTGAVGMVSAVPGWFSAVHGASPLAPALDGVRAVVADAPVGVGPVGSLLLLWMVAVCVGLLAVVRRRRLTPARYRRGAGRAQ